LFDEDGDLHLLPGWTDCSQLQRKYFALIFEYSTEVRKATNQCDLGFQDRDSFVCFHMVCLTEGRDHKEESVVGKYVHRDSRP